MSDTSIGESGTGSGRQRRIYIAVELLIVTTGILVALSVDGARRWIADRALLAEARSNLTTEIRENKQEVESFLKDIGRQRDRIVASREVLQLFIDGKKPKGVELSLGFNFPSISDTSRRTAQVTGAFALMSYAEVKRWESPTRSRTGSPRCNVTRLPSSSSHCRPTTQSLRRGANWKCGGTMRPA
jgi:hypothetical protein